MFSVDRKIPTLRSTVPVGNSTSLVCHWNSGHPGWDFPVLTEHQWWILFIHQQLCVQFQKKNPSCSSFEKFVPSLNCYERNNLLPLRHLLEACFYGYHHTMNRLHANIFLSICHKNFENQLRNKYFVSKNNF